MRPTANFGLSDRHLNAPEPGLPAPITTAATNPYAASRHSYRWCRPLTLGRAIFRSGMSPRHQLQNRHGWLNPDVVRGCRLSVIGMTECVTDPGHGFIDDRGPQGCMRGP